MAEEPELTYEEHRLRNTGIAHELVADLWGLNNLHYVLVGMRPVDDGSWFVQPAGTCGDLALMARVLREAADLFDAALARRKLN